MEDILNMCWYIQGCFHKEAYFHYNHLKKSRYAFTGYGGECVREYKDWRRNKQEYCKEYINIAMNYPFKDNVQIKESLENILRRSCDEINDKLKGFGRAPAPTDSSAFAPALFRETYNRNHFGALMTGCYYSNIFVMAPLLDG